MGPIGALSFRSYDEKNIYPQFDDWLGVDCALNPLNLESHSAERGLCERSTQSNGKEQAEPEEYAGQHQHGEIQRSTS